MNQNELQEKLVRYQILDNRIKVLMKRRELLATKILEIETTLDTIEGIEKKTEKDIFLPLGSGVYVLGSLKKTKKMIVELGANIAMEETVEKTKKILKKRKNVLTKGLQAVENEMVNLSNEMLNLEPEINALLKKPKTSTPKIKTG